MNNIVNFEIRRNLKGFIIWQIAINLTLVAMMCLYPTINDTADEFIKVFSSLPPAVMETINLNIDTIATVVGFYSFAILYVTIVFAIFVSNLAIKIFSYEKTNKIDDYILVKPVSRSKMYLSKYIAGLLLSTIAFLIYLVISFIVLYIFDSNSSFNLNDFVYVSGGFYLLLFVIYNISVLISVLSKKIKIAAAYSTSLVLGLFLLSFIVSILDEPVARFITPFSALSSSAFYTRSNLGEVYIYVLIVVVVTFMIAAIKFIKREV